MDQLVGGVGIKLRYEWFTQLNFSTASESGSRRREEIARSPLWSHMQNWIFILISRRGAPDIRHTSRELPTRLKPRSYYTVILSALFSLLFANEMNENGEEDASALGGQGHNTIRCDRHQSTARERAELNFPHHQSRALFLYSSMHETEQHTIKYAIACVDSDGNNMRFAESQLGQRQRK